MSLGQLFNTAANMSGALSGEKKPEKSLKDFLGALSTYGVQVKSSYEVVYSGFGGITFFVQSANVPGLKANVGNLYYKGRQVTIPVNSEQEHDVSMTILTDGTGYLYNQMRRILEIDARNARLEANADIVMRALGDGDTTAGQIIKLRGATLTQVSGLDFSSTDSGVSTFTASWYVSRIELQWSEVKKKKGLLSGIDKISTLAQNIAG